eukprot:gene45221-62884_t
MALSLREFESMSFDDARSRMGPAPTVQHRASASFTPVGGGGRKCRGAKAVYLQFSGALADMR